MNRYLFFLGFKRRDSEDVHRSPATRRQDAWGLGQDGRVLVQTHLPNVISSR